MFRQTPATRLQFTRSPIFWARLVQCVLLCVVTVAMLGAGTSQFERVGHKLECSCGCSQILLECNHVSCPDSPVMISELRGQIASGVGDMAILQWFAAKYGPTILAAPMRGGFDNAAWIVPMVVFVLATAGTFVVVWFWKRRAGGPPTDGSGGTMIPAGVSGDTALRERIRRETEY